MNTKKYRCLIVDDEPPAIRLLENYISKVSFLEKVGSTTSALEALQIIESQEIDLVFLDIQMPELSGIQVSKIVKGKTKIIFTTAYPQFAIESYDLHAIDYLLKPSEFERFYEAVLKIRKNETPKEVTTNDTFLFVKTDGKNNYEKVYQNEICYIEGLKNYVAVHLLDKVVITYNTLKHIEESLGNSHFVKVHKSYIVAIKHIIKTDSITVYIKEKALPIGDTYKKNFFEKIESYKL
ncbi:DNA-binding response regulator [Dokdonia pacifica]|uniref:Two component transcriptional regulator, LytTR family n=1 Tax=Dokdonia pacifica TaxID=1627892 RepID=A0A239DDL4_9FLAO|nr:LytTR family DNA-binding domain-containing protein [Dokdonia pacifica]GGG39939.1 DNA-binding response regulator [Dokdonia pacifica]SNS30122.1 two component transcriptional regulator, LytTR family [Dokdonia pacifica]